MKKRVAKLKHNVRGSSCLSQFQSSRHPVQCAATASTQPTQSEGQGRRAPGSGSASPCPSPKPWCLNVLLWSRGRGGWGVVRSFLQMATAQCLLCGYRRTGGSGPQVTPTINLANTGKHGKGRKRPAQGSCENSPGWGNQVGGSLSEDFTWAWINCPGNSPGPKPVVLKCYGQEAVQK